MSSYQHVKVPAGGQKITVNQDSSLNVPSFHTSKATGPASTSRP